MSTPQQQSKTLDAARVKRINKAFLAVIRQNYEEGPTAPERALEALNALAAAAAVVIVGCEGLAGTPTQAEDFFVRALELCVDELKASQKEQQRESRLILPP